MVKLRYDAIGPADGTAPGVKMPLMDDGGQLTDIRARAAVGDGSNDDTSAIADAADDRLIFVPRPGDFWRMTQQLALTHPLTVVSYGGLIAQETQDVSVFRLTDDDSDHVRHALLFGVDVTQVDASDPGTGAANNHASYKFLGALDPRVVLATVQTGCLGISFGYGGSGLSDRRGLYGLALGNYLEDLEKMGVEAIGSAYTRIIGNAVNGIRGNSHAFRLTGYGASPDALTARNVGSVMVANVATGMRTGLSIQNATEHVSVVALHSEGNDWGVEVLDGTAQDNNPRHLFLQFTSKGDGVGLRNEGGSHSVFDLNIDSSTGVGVDEIDEADALGHTTYRGVLRNTGSTALSIYHERANLDVVVDGAGATGVYLRPGADGATGKINVADSAGTSVNVASDNCNLQIACDAGGGTYTLECSGDNNVISVNTTASIRISGSGNVIYGRVGTVLRFASSSADNKFIGVYGSLIDEGTDNTTL